MDGHFVFVLIVICIWPSYKCRQAKVHECSCHIFSPMVFSKLTMMVIRFIPELYQVVRLLFFFLVICSLELCQRRGIIVGMKRKVESWKRRRYVFIVLGQQTCWCCCRLLLLLLFECLHLCCHHSVVMSLCFPKSSFIICSNSA